MSIETEPKLVKPRVEAAVGMWMSGSISTTHFACDGDEIGMTISPRPVQILLGPKRKKGTSLPSRSASGANCSGDQFNFQNWFNPSSVRAASELPPPRPAPRG